MDRSVRKLADVLKEKAPPDFRSHFEWMRSRRLSDLYLHVDVALETASLASREFVPAKSIDGAL